MALADKIKSVLQELGSEALHDFVQSSAAEQLQSMVDNELTTLEAKLKSYIDAELAKLKPTA